MMHRGVVVFLSAVVLLFTLIALVSAACVAMDHGKLNTQLLLISGGVLGFVLLQLMFLWDTGNPTSRKRTCKKSELEQARKDMRDAMIYSDLPALIAFVTLLVVVSLLLPVMIDDKLSPLRPFVGGVVAFQLVTTNVVFVVGYWHTPTWLDSKYPRLVGWFKRVLQEKVSQ